MTNLCVKQFLGYLKAVSVIIITLTKVWIFFSPGLYSKLKAEGRPSKVEKATLAAVSGVMSEKSEVHSARSSF